MNVCEGEGKKKNLNRGRKRGGKIEGFFFLRFVLHVDNYVILF